MMGTKQRNIVPLSHMSLEDLVPQDHFYRQLDERLDLSFAYEFVQESYAKAGRPSIDPIVFFKLQLVMFFEGTRSARQLMDQAADRLSVRWYLGYNLDESLPDHSSLMRIRTRYGVEVLRRFFETIVDQCQQAGLVWGKELYADATKVQANAAVSSLKPRFAVEAHLNMLFSAQEGQEQKADDILQRAIVDASRLPLSEGEGAVVIHQSLHEEQRGGASPRQLHPALWLGKDWHGIRRYRLRRLWRVNGEALVRAAGQNLKRLLKKRGWGRHPRPEGAENALLVGFLEAFNAVFHGRQGRWLFVERFLLLSLSFSFRRRKSSTKSFSTRCNAI